MYRCRAGGRAGVGGGGGGARVVGFRRPLERVSVHASLVRRDAPRGRLEQGASAGVGLSGERVPGSARAGSECRGRLERGASAGVGLSGEAPRLQRNGPLLKGRRQARCFREAPNKRRSGSSVCVCARVCTRACTYAACVRACMRVRVVCSLQGTCEGSSVCAD